MKSVFSVPRIDMRAVTTEGTQLISLCVSDEQLLHLLCYGLKHSKIIYENFIVVLSLPFLMSDLMFLYYQSPIFISVFVFVSIFNYIFANGTGVKSLFPPPLSLPLPLHPLSLIKKIMCARIFYKLNLSKDMSAHNADVVL